MSEPERARAISFEGREHTFVDAAGPEERLLEVSPGCGCRYCAATLAKLGHEVCDPTVKL